MEDAATNGQLVQVGIALEDTVWLLNDDHRRVNTFVDLATRRIELSRLPTCHWWQWGCMADRRKVQRSIDQRLQPAAPSP